MSTKQAMATLKRKIKLEEALRKAQSSYDNFMREHFPTPGLVEVEYGRVSVPKEDGGRGYAYRSRESLKLGDVVLVPGNWLVPTPQEATVVSTYSRYQGDVATILRVVDRDRS